VIQVCYICWKTYGEKEPLNDKSHTHGICEACFPGEMEKIDKIKKERAARRCERDCPPGGESLLELKAEVDPVTDDKEGRGPGELRENTPNLRNADALIEQSIEERYDHDQTDADISK